MWGMVMSAKTRLERGTHVVVKQFCAGDAPDVGAHVATDVFGQRREQYDVADREVSSWFQDTEYLAKYGWLVRAEVDDAVRDDQIDGIVVDWEGVRSHLCGIRRSSHRVSPRFRGRARACRPSCPRR